LIGDETGRVHPQGASESRPTEAVTQPGEAGVDQLVKAKPLVTLGDAGRTVKTLLCLSVVANLCLVIDLMRSLHSSGRRVVSGEKTAESQSELPKKASQVNDVRAASGATANPLGMPFLWSEVESADFRQYIANLRAIGCPEATIRDMVAADLIQLYASHAAAIWKQPAPPPYWQRPVNKGPDAKKLRELSALSKEQNGVLQDLLGTRVTQQELVDTIYLQFYGSEQELAFLPEQRREAAVQAVAGLDEDLQESMRAGDYSESRRDAFGRKLELLAKILSPAELDEFKLRNAPAAENLRMETRYFDCSPEEFKMLLDARMQDKKNESFGPDLLNRAAAAEQVRKLFGDERARGFEQKSEMYYMNCRWAAEDLGLSAETGEAAWKVTREIREAASRLAAVMPLSSTEGKIRLDELIARARSQLEAMLGPAATRSIVRDLRVVITVPPAPARPSP
jgi:hypothetical protein